MNFFDTDIIPCQDVPIADKRIKTALQTEESVKDYNHLLTTYKHVYLRVGLTREWKDNYWIQINTIKGTHD